MTRRDEAGPKGPRGPGGDRLVLDWLGLLCIVSFVSCHLNRHDRVWQDKMTMRMRKRG
ncbi:hypothetical protein BO83DRAFT_381976, partial [Aspergillus eucalypticola CBS 122712]